MFLLKKLAKFASFVQLPYDVSWHLKIYSQKGLKFGFVDPNPRNLANGLKKSSTCATFWKKTTGRLRKNYQSVPLDRSLFRKIISIPPSPFFEIFTPSYFVFRATVCSLEDFEARLNQVKSFCYFAICFRLSTR